MQVILFCFTKSNKFDTLRIVYTSHHLDTAVLAGIGAFLVVGCG